MGVMTGLGCHNRAMDLADAALRLRRRGLPARHLFREAMLLEKRVAALEDGRLLPKAVLWRSAACLALDCQDYLEATNLARAGLVLNPCGDEMDELGRVLRAAYRGRLLADEVSL